MTVTKRPSDEAVKKATGKAWDAWFAFLDKKGADTMKHKEMAEMLSEKKYIKNGWWSQMVTNAYEKARGRRVVGQTEDAGFQIGVTKTLPMSTKDLWKLITSSEGIALWLGRGTKLKFTPDEPYETADGTRGEIRTVRAGTRIRMTWQPKKFPKPTTLQLTVIPRKSTRGTCLSFHHENLANAKQREMMRRHWQGVLDRLGGMIARE